MAKKKLGKKFKIRKESKMKGRKIEIQENKQIKICGEQLVEIKYHLKPTNDGLPNKKYGILRTIYEFNNNLIKTFIKHIKFILISLFNIKQTN